MPLVFFLYPLVIFNCAIFYFRREFEHGRATSGVEVAAEVVERSTSPSEHSITSSGKRRDLVSL